MIDAASLIPSIVGLGIKTGMAIPALKKPKKVEHRQQAARLGGMVQGAAQGGHGASRGLALREGLRAAAEATGRIADAEAQASERVQAYNQAAMVNRSQRMAEFGTDLAKGLGDMAAIAVGPKTEQEKATEALQYPVAHSGYGQPGSEQYDPTKHRGDVVAGTPGGIAAESQQLNQQNFINDAQRQLDQLQQQRQQVYPDAQQPAQGPDPVSQVMQQGARRMDPGTAEAVAFQLHMEDLMLSQAERMGFASPRMQVRIQQQLGMDPLNPGDWGLV